MKNIEFRIACEDDAFPLMKLYQLSSQSIMHDPIFLDYLLLKKSIVQENEMWVVAVKSGEIIAMISSLFDTDQRFCKLQRIYCMPETDETGELQKELILFVIEQASGKADIIYTTTRLLTFKQVAITEDAGFNVIGFFPITTAISEIGGLTAYFYKGVLDEMRYVNFSLHPIIEPFYELIRKKLSLGQLPLVDRAALPKAGELPLPELEVISASKFVERRYRHLRERRSLSSNFYPFQEPNTLICDPEQKIEIFAGIHPEKRFGSIIEERLELAVNPSLLYGKVAYMLSRENVSFIEVIIDAADASAIDLLLDAGFLPCAYFPCLKKHDEFRRDFVIMGRTFENLHLIGSPIRKSFADFIREYFKLEMRMLMQRSSRFKEDEII